MAHFAELNADNIVTRVIVVGNPDCLDKNGQESEAVGIAFCQQLFGSDTRWVQTSYNSNFRNVFAGPGCTYNEKLDAFIGKQPFPSFILNEETLEWEAPIPRPDDGNLYLWDEDTTSWITPPTEPTT